MIAGGSEASITPMGVGGFASMRALSTRNDDPAHASRPFDKDRDGFVVGEGAGILVLEELETARRRGARIYAEVVGYGLSGDAYHLTAQPPDANGAVRSMRMALRKAGIAPADVDYINAHGTSTPINDPTETQAVKTVFGDHAHKLVMSSTKSMTGHLLGAAGGLEAGISVLAVQTPDRAADHQPRQSRSGVRSRLRCQCQTAAGHSLRPLQLVRLRRHQRDARLQAIRIVRIAVCLKQVVTRESPVRLDRAGSWIDETQASWELNEPDAYALEAALAPTRTARRRGRRRLGRPRARHAGPSRGARTRRRSRHPRRRRSPCAADAATTVGGARRRSAGRRRGPRVHRPAVRRPGRRTGWRDAGRAAGAPHASIVMAIEVSGTTLKVKRELENGWSQWLTLPLPAVLTIQSGINQLRYATLKGIMGAKKKEHPDCLRARRPRRSAHRPFVRAGTRARRPRCLAERPQRPPRSLCARSASARGSSRPVTMAILVVAETREHGLHPVSVEAIAAAARFGGPSKSSFPVTTSRTACREVSAYDVASVTALGHPALAAYTADAFVGALAAFISQRLA